MDAKDFARQVENLAALEDPVRRKLYLLVVARGADVSRDQAARAAGISRELAAFHLDKLVEANLLQTSFRRLSGRAGPGAGRPSKLYRRSGIQIEVSLPRRRYELAAQVLARAVAQAPSAETLAALRKSAFEWGAHLADESGHGSGGVGRGAGSSGGRAGRGGSDRAGRGGGGDTRGRRVQRAIRALRASGFEPQATKTGEVILRNCPFDALRADCSQVICSLNLALVEGLLAGLGVEGVRARLAPGPDRCCVVLDAGQSE